MSTHIVPPALIHDPSRRDQMKEGRYQDLIFLKVGENIIYLDTAEARALVGRILADCRAIELEETTP